MRFLVLGAGRMGYAVVYDLLRNRNVKQVMVVDAEDERLEVLKATFKDERLAALRADVSECEELAYLKSGCDVLISCVTYKFNYEIAKAAM